MASRQPLQHETFKEKLNRIIFGTDTTAGRNFDLLLIAAIVISVIAVMLDSIGTIDRQYTHYLRIIEWFFTLLFTVEYALRLYSSRNRSAYARSFYGIVDLLAILPTYLSLLIPSANMLMIIRLLRVLRIFRILKLLQYTGEANLLLRSVRNARKKIFIFLFSVLVVITIFGSLMYVVEGPAYGFTSIPRSIYWAIVTVTTVGYGDITPQTIPGQVIASAVMLIGYAILAVPTGIISAELLQEMQQDRLTARCRNCEKTGHEGDAQFCKYCGCDLKRRDHGLPSESGD